MNQELLDKYFKDQCSEDELNRVLKWFNTDEGRAYIENEIKKDSEHGKSDREVFIYRSIDSQKVFNRIQRDKRQPMRKKRRFYLRVASILLLVGLVSFFLFKGLTDAAIFNDSESSYITYVAKPGHHKIINLSGGTVITLNEDSKLIVPEQFAAGMRTVQLVGEAFFEVAHDAGRLFIVHAGGATIHVLGTKFNVKTDTVTHRVQVAVLRGKVKLKKAADGTSGAILTRNMLGVLNLKKNEIKIERTDVNNYLSWMSGRLTFNSQTLSEISRQLEYIYGIEIDFESDKLKKLKLTAMFQRGKVENTLNIIANTLEIKIEKNDTGYVWSTQ